VSDLRRSRSTRQLSLACISIDPDPSLPSWVPDWTAPFPCHVLRPKARHSRDVGLLAFPETVFQPIFRNNDRQLQVRAIPIDTIAICGEAKTAAANPDMRRWRMLRPTVVPTTIHSQWIQMAFFDSTDATRAVRMQELFETVNGEDNQIYNEENRRIFEMWIRINRVLGMVVSLRLYRIHWIIHEILAQAIMYALMLTGYLDQTTDAGYLKTSGRRVCETVGGHLVLAPARTMEGDVVTILEGGSMPFILRGQREGSETMRLVGEAHMPVLSSTYLSPSQRLRGEDNESIALMGWNGMSAMESVLAGEFPPTREVWLE
jgi:hypothetical protein